MSFYFLEATAFVKLFVQEPGTDLLIGLMEAAEDNRKLISASTPLETYAVIRRRERAGDLKTEDAASALSILRQEAARQLLDRTTLRWPDALQLGSALAARDMFQGTEIVFVSASAQLLEAAAGEGFKVLDPVKEVAEAARNSDQ